MLSSKTLHNEAILDVAGHSNITFLLYSDTNAANLKHKLGQAEYSYYFVREQFRTLLEKHANVIVVTQPEIQVDALYDAQRAKGMDCVLLAFCPPHKMPPPTRCPTVVVFAWEFDTIPTETWDFDARNDWRTVLARLGHAITHSTYSALAVKAAMGSDFHVESMPAPVWDGYAIDRQSLPYRPLHEPVAIDFLGTFLDSNRLPPTYRLFSRAPRRTLAERLKVKKRVARLKRNLRKLAGQSPKPPPLPVRKRVQLEFGGVVFISVFCPVDGRKNWTELVTAFCSSLSDCPDATLILKFVGADCSVAMSEVGNILVRLPPFKCRVIAIDGFLDDDCYRRLITASTYAVNCSLAEGQCLPLMEAMSCGKPVLAPPHTGMSEYVDRDVGFPLRSSRELCSWPHDPRGALRAHRYRGDWQSLTEAYREAYLVAKDQPEQYRKMSRAAATRMQGYCSQEVVYGKLLRFLAEVPALSRADAGRDAA